MSTHNLTDEQVHAAIEYLKADVLPAAVASLDADGFYMTDGLPRPTAAMLARVLTEMLGRDVGCFAEPPVADVHVYYLPDRIDLQVLYELAKERASLLAKW